MSVHLSVVFLHVYTENKMMEFIEYLKHELVKRAFRQ